MRAQTTQRREQLQRQYEEEAEQAQDQAQVAGSNKHKYHNKLYKIRIGSRGGKYILVKGTKKYI
jgi:hypothetical protein